MSFFATLQNATERERIALFQSPLMLRCLDGKIHLEHYVDFLTQAYHHVKHTVPLLMAVGARLPESKEWLREAIAEYIEEELGHQEWILNDIRACGADAEAVRRGLPHAETEWLVAYAYDMVNRVEPLGFFGMVHVLEGTSIAAADTTASIVQHTLNLPNQAFSYLRSHGALDQEHVVFFESLMNRIEDPAEQKSIVHAAKHFYRLYTNMLNSVEAHVATQQENREEAHHAIAQ